MRRRRAGSITLIVLAAVCALVPVPRTLVEAWYSRGVYPHVQRALTSVSNLISIALLDVGAAVLLVVVVAWFVSRVRRRGLRAALWNSVAGAATIAAALYLAFLLLWGLNYRRVPLEEQLDYDRARVNRESVLALANQAAAAINAGYHAAHATSENRTALEYAFADAQGKLGAQRFAVPGKPKRSVLTLYFRRAAIDGMTDPFFLEVIVNPDVLAFERPFVLAHEWGHLAGFANEAEANFVAWLTCMRGDALAQYSGWLAAYEHAMRALPRQDRSSVTALDPGPRDDQRAMAERYARSSPVVREAARGVYDEYLRANRVREGIGSYDAVVRLMVGTRFDAGWTPRMR